MKRLRPLRAPVLVTLLFFGVIELFRLSAGVSVPATSPADPIDVRAYMEQAGRQPIQDGRHGGRMTVAVSGAPDTFNEAIATNNSTTQILNWVFDGLVVQDLLTMDYVPALAESWEHDESGLVWTFHLRRGVEWFDGAPFTADDVVFTFNEITYNEDIPASARAGFTFEVADPESGAIRTAKMRVEKVDDHTVRFTLPVRFAPFLGQMSAMIFPAHILRKHVEDGSFNSTWDVGTAPEKIIGTGPFMLAHYELGERVELRRNPRYWRFDGAGQRLPYLDSFVFVVIKNREQRVNYFQARLIDYFEPTARDYPFLKRTEEEKDFKLWRLGPDSGQFFITFNQNTDLDPRTGEHYIPKHKLDWFTRTEFRQAVSYALDRRGLIDLSQNSFGYPQWSPIGPSNGFFHNPHVKTYPYDPEKARELLAGIGILDRDGDGVLEDASGHDIEFVFQTYPGPKVYSNLIREDLNALGFRAYMKETEFNKIVKQITHDFDWECILLGFTGGTEPHSGRNMWASSGNLHLWHPEQKQPATAWEARIDELYRLAAEELDRDQRRRYYEEFQEIAAEQCPLIHTTLGEQLFCLRNKFVNVRPSPFGQTTFYGVFHNVYQIYVNDRYRETPAEEAGR